MKAIYLIFAILIFGTNCLYAQKEAAVWLFNNGPVLDFNYEPPVFSFKNPIPSAEANVQSISNAKGELLFYNIGHLLYDSKHTIVADDIKGTWDGVIIPVPKDEHLFYLITTDTYYHMATNRLIPTQGYINDTITSYSLIHIDDNKNLTIKEKNKHLLKNGATRVAATLHADGVSVWVLTMDVFLDNFYAFLITDCGISQTVVSPLESDTTMLYGKSGNLRISPNGKTISAYDNFVFDFDSKTGKVSNPIMTDPQPSFAGSTFSPNSLFIYGSKYQNKDWAWYKWDINAKKKTHSNYKMEPHMSIKPV